MLVLVCLHMVLKDLIDEIRNYKNTSAHKSALDIHRLLDSNKDLFLEKMNPDNFKHLLIGFESLSYGNPNDYNTPSFIREYDTLYKLLLFYLDRIN
ncbi:MAG: hypothetical protein V4565_13655 [Bacteroidota bacterium]